MLRYIQQIWRSRFARNVALVASGTAGAQAITMAFYPAITRIYGPEAFGVLGTFIAILAVLMPMAALGYPVAIVLPKRDADAINLAKLSIAIALVTSVSAGLILTLFKSPIVRAFSLQTVEAYIFLVPLAMFFSTTLAIMSQWVIRKKFFKAKAKIAVMQAFWLGSAKVGIGVMAPVAFVLVVLATLGSALHAIMLWVATRKNVSLPQPPNKRGYSNKELLVSYKDFPLFQMPQQVLNAVSQSIPVIMLAALYGFAVVGFYALAKTIIMLPTSLISKSVGDVFYSKFRDIVETGGKASAILLKATATLALIGLLPLITLFLFAEDLFSYIFGPEWSESGVFASWLAIWVFFSFLNPPSVKAVIVLRRQKIALIINALSVILRISAVYIGYVIYSSALLSIIFFSVAGVIHNIIFILIAYLSTREHEKNNEA